jgi:hypothetical protein
MQINSSPRRWSIPRLARYVLAVAGLCAGFVLLGQQYSVVQTREQMKADIVRRGGLVGLASGGQELPPFRRLLGDRSVASVSLIPGSFSDGERARVGDLFPEADVRELDVVDPDLSPAGTGGFFGPPPR